MTSHLTSEYAGIQRSSWLTQCLPGAQVLWMHNKAKSSPLHHCARQLVRVDCANIMFGCLPTWPCTCLQYSQTSSLCSYLSKGHCCTSLCKPKSSCHHSFQKAGFLLHIFSNKPFLFSLFLNCTVLTIFLLLKLLTWPYNPSQTIGLLIPDVLPECCRPSN